MNTKRKTSSTAGGSRTARSAAPPQGESVRDSVEAVVVAIILTLTFRTLLGENYQIPTGSMAPTLQGTHLDIVCEECGYQYRTGASIENPENGPHRMQVDECTCPICRHTMALDRKQDRNQGSFGGDRIVVSKVAYLNQEPKRWDVFVFKYPGNAKINYIKRLIGLPGERIRIRHGDIWIGSSGATGVASASAASDENGSGSLQIARKPPDKAWAMQQLVDDTYHLSASLRAVEWPSRWADIDANQTQWRLLNDGGFRVDSPPEDAWLGYRHLVPRPQDWAMIYSGGEPDITRYYGQLITDYYEYNDLPRTNSEGWHWVGDLAMEGDVEVEGNQGELLLNCIEGGIHHTCRIDVATGTATLSLANGQLKFHGDGSGAAARVGATPVRGPGRWRVRLANVDDQVFLWVNDRLVTFDGPTSFDSPPDLTPRWSAEDSGDLTPLRLGSRQVTLKVHRLRVFRDVYYVATNSTLGAVSTDYDGEWEGSSRGLREDRGLQMIREILSNPTQWGTTDLFRERRSVEFALSNDQFFPLGDNSPASKDARLWSVPTTTGLSPPPFVSRHLLIGKALCVYWPHAWDLPFAPCLIPNFQRFGLIR